MLWTWAILDRQAGNPKLCEGAHCLSRARVVRIKADARRATVSEFFCLTHAKQTRRFNRRVRELAEMRAEHRRSGDQC